LHSRSRPATCGPSLRSRASCAISAMPCARSAARRRSRSSPCGCWRRGSVRGLAVGIGATTAIFSRVDTMLVRGMTYPKADRLVVLIGNVQRAAGVERRGNSYPDHVDWRARATSFDDMAAYTTLNTTLQGSDEPERIP